ncbi:hypothetical protein GCM10011366_10950 [Ornithinimicrobium tianjinense]|uniref:Uncharacterized protein n=2 Tax=Ornithinimicrobium tianjinense TaxID=1195761 RepID=A0A917BJK2_9MICO|nr:hypothetical protein GCM10011366_10950 [Ornithinimicrobium tianjinense]
MKVDIIVTDANNCIAGGESICIESVTPPNGSVEKTSVKPSQCTNEGGTITVYLEGVSNCTVNMVVGFRVAGGPLQFTTMKSDNISDSAICPIVPPADAIPLN